LTGLAELNDPSAIGKTRPRKSVRKCFRAYMGIHSGARVKLAGKSQPPLNFYKKVLCQSRGVISKFGEQKAVVER
jgi:hypothetical protein